VQPDELGHDDGLQVRPVPAPHLAALERDLGERLRLLHGPAGHFAVQEVGERAFLQRVGDGVRQPHGLPGGDHLQEDDAQRVHVGLGAHQPRLLVLRVDVAEGARRRRLPVLRRRRGAVHGPRDDARQPDVADLGHEVAVKEDVARLEVAVHERLGLHLVQVQQAARDLHGDPEPELPWQRRRAGVAEEPLLQAAVRHVLVHQAPVLRARSDQVHHVPVTNVVQQLNLTNDEKIIHHIFFI